MWILAGGNQNTSGEKADTELAVYFSKHQPKAFGLYHVVRSKDVNRNSDRLDYSGYGGIDNTQQGLTNVFFQEYSNEESSIILEIFLFEECSPLSKTMLPERFPSDLTHLDDSYLQDRILSYRQGNVLINCYSNSKDAQPTMFAIAENAEKLITAYDSQMQESSGRRVKSIANEYTIKDDGPLVIIGASYAQGWKTHYHRDLRIINKGVSGDTTPNMLDRFSSDVVAEHPSAVIIWGFINDIFRSPREDIDTNLAKSMANLKEMIALAAEANILPIVATEVTIRPPSNIKEFILGAIGRLRGRQSYQDYVNQKVQFVNRWLRDYTRKEGIPLLDLESVLADSSGMRAREYATDDGSHISEAGYDKLNAYILNELDTLIME